MLVIEAVVRNQDSLFSSCLKVVIHFFEPEEVLLEAKSSRTRLKARIPASPSLHMGLLTARALGPDVP